MAHLRLAASGVGTLITRLKRRAKGSFKIANGCQRRLLRRFILGATEPNSSRMQESSAMTVSEMTCASSVGTQTAGDDNECSRAGAAPRVGLLIVVSTVAVFYGGIAAYIWHLL